MLELKGLTPGLSSVVQKRIDHEDTAVHYGSGLLDRLLATPTYVAMMIKAATEVVDPKLPDGFVTVGKSMEFTHEAPTALGMTITVKATLEKVDGNRLFFKIDACDEIGTIGFGRHERVVVNEVKLWDKAKERMGIIAQDDLK
ncbi:MAG TPA: hypothetical protein PLN25_11420 [Deltaproteobacteria bacterium]|nr:hypothetical protein [Deltaproteobacteria bacterium]HQB37649.1 hypothetical protein [Deltaproteobacteria bacterium]